MHGNETGNSRPAGRYPTLLNRWIVPLEKRYDFLNMASGKRIQVPFDQMVVFSTNLEPRDLVDDAFLRRIPYKIEVTDPDESAFRTLLKMLAAKLSVEYDEEAADYLLQRHYNAVNRPLRCCQPRDLLLQIRNFSSVHRQPREDDRGLARLCRRQLFCRYVSAERLGLPLFTAQR